MQVRKISEVEKEPAAGPLFTSDDVSRQPLAPDSDDFNVSVVSFGVGVRNKFHYHESDQLLIVTEGRGVVVTESGERAGGRRGRRGVRARRREALARLAAGHVVRPHHGDAEGRPDDADGGVGATLTPACISTRSLSRQADEGAGPA